MQDWQAYFKGKKITVMGLGLLGRGVGDAKFLAENGAELIVTDLKTEAELETSLKELAGFPNITYRLGGHDVADFRDRDFILKAASVPPNSPHIAEARKAGVPVKMSASWFSELSGVPIVGITGTRGKSTATYLIYEILKAAGVPVLLGGNVRGVSTLSLLSEVREGSIAVFELDSWQCQGFGDMKASPHVAVFTTFYPDHLNYYESLGEYLDDKAQIFFNQKEGDTLVLGSSVASLIRNKYGDRIRSRIVIADPGDFPSGWNIQIAGAHNLLNAMCAIETARSLGVDEAVIKDVLATFPGVPGRLEFLRDLNGIKIYNDTTATTPEATIAALYALPGSRTILVMGGSDKGLDMGELIGMIPTYVKRLVLLSGTGTEKLVAGNPGLFENVPVYDSLDAAVKDAYHSATKGDIILFSPAFASFGMFKNEFDRGEQFMKLVQSLP